MIEVNKERKIEVYGVCFSGVSELKKWHYLRIQKMEYM